MQDQSISGHTGFEIENILDSSLDFGGQVELTGINHLGANRVYERGHLTARLSVVSGRLPPHTLSDNICAQPSTRKRANLIPTFSLGSKPYMPSQRQWVIKVSRLKFRNSQQEAAFQNFTPWHMAFAFTLTIWFQEWPPGFNSNNHDSDVNLPRGTEQIIIWVSIFSSNSEGDFFFKNLYYISDAARL